MSKVADDESQRSLTLAENTAIISKLFVAEAKEKRIARQVVWLQIVAVLAAGGFTYGMEGALQLTAAVLSGGGYIRSQWCNAGLANVQSGVAFCARHAHSIAAYVFLRCRKISDCCCAPWFMSGTTKIIATCGIRWFCDGSSGAVNSPIQAVLLIARLFISNSKT